MSTDFRRTQLPVNKSLKFLLSIVLIPMSTFLFLVCFHGRQQRHIQAWYSYNSVLSLVTSPSFSSELSILLQTADLRLFFTKNKNRKQHRKFFQKAQQLRGTCLLTRTPNFVNPPSPCELTARRFVRVRENSRELFHGFVGLHFMGISYSVVQVIFKAASHPLIPLSSPHPTIG